MFLMCKEGLAVQTSAIGYGSSVSEDLRMVWIFLSIGESKNGLFGHTVEAFGATKAGLVDFNQVKEQVFLKGNEALPNSCGIYAQLAVGFSNNALKVRHGLQFGYLNSCRIVPTGLHGSGFEAKVYSGNINFCHRGKCHFQPNPRGSF